MASLPSADPMPSGEGLPGPFPMHLLRRTERPTTLITDAVQRVDFRDMAFQRAGRGEYGPAVQRKLLCRLRDPKEPLYAALQQPLAGLAANRPLRMGDSPALAAESPAVLSRHIKSLGYFLKADIMGICRLPPSAVYSHDANGDPIEPAGPFAIVIVTGKDYRTLHASTGCDWISGALSYQSYQSSALIAQNIANYIRKLGYPAQAQHGTGRYDVLIPPLLLWAGIGEVSRCGIVLNPFLGMHFKASAVVTSLPLKPDQPIDFGLQDFCRHCRICAEACPSQAISRGDQVMHNGYATWKLDEKRCASFFIMNPRGSGCLVCTKVCPWTRPNTWPHNLVRWAVMRNSLARRIAASIDTRRLVPKGHREGKWWFDLEEVSGAPGSPAGEAGDGSGCRR